MALLDERPVLATLGVPRDFYPTLGVNIVMTAALAALYAQTGLATIAFVLAVILAFAYMMRLVVVARERTREYANLSWGVLSLADPDARRARQARRAPLRRRREVLARHRRARRDEPRATRSSRTPRGCCTTSAGSRCRTA